MLQGWTVWKPIVVEATGTVVMPYTKVGGYIQSHDRNWVITSPNILTEPDPTKIRWHTYPEGDGGVSQGCGPVAGDIAEEGGVVVCVTGK